MGAEAENGAEKKFRNLNAVSSAGGVVLFGSTWASGLPVCELAQDYGVKEKVYNRSVPGMTVFNAKEHLECCVNTLLPEKVFISIGDVDAALLDFDIKRFLEEYEWLLYQIHSAVRSAKLYVMSVVSVGGAPEMTADVNRSLRRLAEDNGCVYVDITDAERNGYVEVFNSIVSHIHVGKLTFADAMGMTRYSVV